MMANMTEISTIGKFEANVNDFIDYLRDLFEDCKTSGCQIVPDTLLEIGIKVVKGYPTRELIEALIESSYVHWQHICDQNEKYFNENLDAVFAGLKMQNVGLFKKLLTATDEKGELIVTDEDRDNIWAFLNSFVKLSLLFVHEERQPMIRVTVDDTGNVLIENGKPVQKAVYTREYMEDIQLPKYFKMFNRRDVNFKRRFVNKYYVRGDGTPYIK